MSPLKVKYRQVEGRQFRNLDVPFSLQTIFSFWIVKTSETIKKFWLCNSSHVNVHWHWL